MSTITLSLPDEIERKLQARAKDQDRDVTTVAIEILEKELQPPAKPENPNDLPYDEWHRRFKAMVTGHPMIDVVVDDSRETIYEGRGE